MTVLGVAGCTALLLIGFGIQDSILPMLNRQTTELNHSDLTISYSDARAFSVEHGLGDVLDSSADVTSWGRFYNKSVIIYNASGDKQTVSIVTAEDESQMTAYFTFRTRQGHKAIPFDDSSAILTEKTAESLGLAVGDTFEVETSNGSRKTLTLTGITENYVFTRLYLSQAQLRTLTGGTLPEWNTVYGQTDCPTSDDRNTLRTDLLACNYVSGVSFMEDTTEMFDNLIGCLNYVVIPIIVCAAALAAVVLYNLISVNLGERKKAGHHQGAGLLRQRGLPLHLPRDRPAGPHRVAGGPCAGCAAASVHRPHRGDGPDDVHPLHRAPQLPVQRSPHPLLHRRRLPPHAPPCPEHQHGRKHEGTGIRKHLRKKLPSAVDELHPIC